MTGRVVVKEGTDLPMKERKGRDCIERKGVPSLGGRILLALEGRDSLSDRDRK